MSLKSLVLGLDTSITCLPGILPSLAEVRGIKGPLFFQGGIKGGEELVPDVRNGERVFAAFAGDGVPGVVTAFGVLDFEARLTRHGGFPFWIARVLSDTP